MASALWASSACRIWFGRGWDEGAESALILPPGFDRIPRMDTPPPVDFFYMDSLLSDEERQVRDTVARFVNEKVLPVVPRAFEEHRFPAELVP